MASGPDLRAIAKARLKSAEILMAAKDWEAAAYMLGYALECALKAMICKNLHIPQYPDPSTKDSTTVRTYFMTHRFDQLLIVSGLSHLFSTKGPGLQNWSDFTLQYPGDWPGMRYDSKRMSQFNSTLVPKLYRYLVEPKDGILSIIKKRW